MCASEEDILFLRKKDINNNGCFRYTSTFIILKDKTVQSAATMLLLLAVACVYLIFGTDTAYLSYKAQTNSTSVVYWDYASYATDGIDYTNFNCYHSGYHYQPWMKVDLSHEHMVTSVTIINMVDQGRAFHKRLLDAEVRIGSDYSYPSTLCGSVTDVQTSPIIDIICPVPIIGRYVMVWLSSKTQYLSFCEIKVYAEYEYVTDYFQRSMNPITLFTLSMACLLENCYGKLPIRPCNYGNNECADDTSESIEVTMALDPYSSGIQTLTIAFYVYPYQSSMGDIIGLSEKGTSLRIQQTYSNGNLYQSEVTVFYGNQELTRAHVLLPEVWTFLTLTFDGINQNVKLWRNGEIASIGYTQLTHLDFYFNETTIKIGHDGSEAQANVAMFQIYDRVFDESEIKSVRDRSTNGQDGLYETLLTLADFQGKILYTVHSRSLVHCGQMCKSKCCDVFKFTMAKNSCTLYSTQQPQETFAVINGEHFRHINVI